MIDTILSAGRAAIANGQARHYGGFVLAGVSALATDTVILSVLTRIAGMSPFVARPIGIAVAMIVSWLINRTLTFQAKQPPSLTEFGRFAAVSVTSQLVNYLCFASILLALPGTMPELALFFACFVSMIVSYVGFRFGVFQGSGAPTRGGH